MNLNLFKENNNLPSMLFCTEKSLLLVFKSVLGQNPFNCQPIFKNQSRTNGPINAHLTIAQVMPRYNHNNEKQEALL